MPQTVLTKCADRPQATFDRTQQLLESARQKLLTADLPPLLRMTAFLRISCRTLDEPGAYSKLMQKLSSYREWWMSCKATPAGTLQSANPEINLLLEPIHFLHQPQTLPLAA